MLVRVTQERRTRRDRRRQGREPFAAAVYVNVDVAYICIDGCRHLHGLGCGVWSLGRMVCVDVDVKTSSPTHCCLTYRAIIRAFVCAHSLKLSLTAGRHLLRERCGHVDVPLGARGILV